MSYILKEAQYEFNFVDFGENDHSSFLVVAEEEGEEAARMQVVAAHEIGYYKVEYFLIRDWQHRLILGRRFMQLLRKAVSSMGGEEVLIYPCAETYEGVGEVPVDQWYEFLETLGFRFAKEGTDRHKPCQEMKVNIE